ncbi:uncharacterized protein LOC112873726 isoform X2 [Panicum hallii]|uniref:uncharacterized protein LOC112873726 isoform X2 n=2 Tax=Panicum hallii TaxID=206008 RepID=UPI000DF4DD12|nr:uncharacterized protein LOC112873726 isoform X2 [Panicum hallii]
MIEDAGFGGLLKIGFPTFPLGFCGWLLRRFDTDYCELVIKGRGRIPVTSDSVLGPNGGGDVKYCLDEDAIAFMFDRFGVSGRYSPTVKSIENSLKHMKSADEHFLRTFMVLAVSSFLCPTTSLRISPRCFLALVDIGSIRELNWCEFVVEQLRKSISAYGRKSSVSGCLFYLVNLYLDSLDTRDIQIPDGAPRISAWNKKLVNKVIEMDMKDNGSFGKCLASFRIPLWQPFIPLKWQRICISYELTILFCICFQRYMQLKRRAPDNIKSRGASSTSAILGGIPEIADFVSTNVAAGYSAQKK